MYPGFKLQILDFYFLDSCLPRFCVYLWQSISRCIDIQLLLFPLVITVTVLWLCRIWDSLHHFNSHTDVLRVSCEKQQCGRQNLLNLTRQMNQHYRRFQLITCGGSHSCSALFLRGFNSMVLWNWKKYKIINVALCVVSCRQLADVTKDGALSLDEFNTAMHLVVLRRNNIDLPDSLPSTLVPPPTMAAPVRPPTAELPSNEPSPPCMSPPTGDPTTPPRSKEVLQVSCYWALFQRTHADIFYQVLRRVYQICRPSSKKRA